MNDLEKHFRNNTGRLIFKWRHYFEVYEKHFSRFRGKECAILEIGVSQGGSLRMWKEYFGPKAAIYGIDIDPRCKAFEEENIRIIIGSQSDRKFMRNITAVVPPVDLLIDDGGHGMRQQIVAFEELFNHIKPDGIYFCEDCHTSYRWRYGGGYKRKNTFMEYSKNWIDKINAFHSKTGKLTVDDFTRSAKSLHYYDSIVVIEKGKVEKPVESKTGAAAFNDPPFKKITVKALFNYAFSLFRIPFYFE